MSKSTDKTPRVRALPPVGPDGAGERLDRWLARTIPDLSRSRLKALIEDGAVSIARHVMNDPARKVRAGDLVVVSIPPARAAEPLPQAAPLDIVYEDGHVIVVNKPPGMVVHPAAGNPDGTLVNALLAHCGDSLKGIGGVLRPGIVHRIDKDTSGLLVAAKTSAAHDGLAKQLAAHTVERIYDAVVFGIPRPAVGTITGNIGRSKHNRKKMAVLKSGGKAAETDYKVIQALGATAALVECRLKTGRTHQIRVHMASRGHPLIGDKTYGGTRGRSLRSVAPDSRAAIETFPRQALHARTLGFIHPVTGKKMSFAREMPADMRSLVASLKEVARAR